MYVCVCVCPQEAKLTDGAGQKPAYNLRTLCRALDYARTTAPTYGLQRALYDGFAMAFVTQVSVFFFPSLLCCFCTCHDMCQYAQSACKSARWQP